MKHTKKLVLAGLVTGLLTLSTGCVQTIYSKSVAVKRDASGKVVETVETETVSQPGQQPKYIGFDHLKARSGDTEAMKPK